MSHVLSTCQTWVESLNAVRDGRRFLMDYPEDFRRPAVQKKIVDCLGYVTACRFTAMGWISENDAVYEPTGPIAA